MGLKKLSDEQFEYALEKLLEPLKLQDGQISKENLKGYKCAVQNTLKYFVEAGSEELIAEYIPDYAQPALGQEKK